MKVSLCNTCFFFFLIYRFSEVLTSSAGSTLVNLNPSYLTLHGHSYHFEIMFFLYLCPPKTVGVSERSILAKTHTCPISKAKGSSQARPFLLPSQQLPCFVPTPLAALLSRFTSSSHYLQYLLPDFS